MATKIPTDEKFERQDFDLFEALTALDKKDYAYYDRLSDEQQKKFVPYMLTHWMSAIKGKGDVQGFYLMKWYRSILSYSGKCCVRLAPD